MTNDPMDRFDKLLKAMSQGEPPKSGKTLDPENGAKKNLGKADQR